MMNSAKLKSCDIEKTYSTVDFVKKIRRLADCLERDERFDIQIAGERIFLPKHPIFNIEHGRNEGDEEIEFQIKWKYNV